MPMRLKIFAEEKRIFHQIKCSIYLLSHNQLFVPVLFVLCFPAAAPYTLNGLCFADFVQRYVYGGSGPLKIIESKLI
jgi:Na+-translocating ferredoxin:NAD+ oxidoreductase RnfD subunit